MKRTLLLFIFTTFSLLSFSQTEIWGVKQYAGLYNGGVLFSVDSATHKIIIQHRFDPGPYYLSYGVPGNPLKYLESEQKYLGIYGNRIFKYDPVFSKIESNVLNNTQAYSSFSQEIDDYTYVVKQNGVLKINLANLRVEKTFELYPAYLNNTAGFAQTNDDKLILAARHANHQLGNAIFMLDTKLDSLFPILFFNDIDSAQYTPYSNLFLQDNLVFGLSYKEIDSYKFLIVYSFDLSTAEFKEEATLAVENVSFETKWIYATDSTYYGIVKPSNSEGIYYVFHFNAETKELSLAQEIPHDYGNGFRADLVETQDKKLIGVSFKGSGNNSGCIFSFDINTLQLTKHLVFDSVFKLTSKYGFVVADNNDLLITLRTKKGSYLNDAIYSYRLDDNTLVKRSSIFKEELRSFNPVDIVQIDNEIILGLTTHSIDTNSSYNYTGNLFEFNPLTKRYAVVYEFNSINEYNTPKQIFKIPNDKALVIREKNGYPSKLLLSYDRLSRTIDSLGVFNSSVSQLWDQETDTSFIHLNASENSIERYHLLTNEMEVLYKFPDSLGISNIRVFNKDTLVYQIKYSASEKRKDSVLLNGLDLVSLNRFHIDDLTRFITNNRYFDFRFIIAKDKSLLGIMVEKWVDEKDSYTRSLAGKYSIYTHEFVQAPRCYPSTNYHGAAFIDDYEGQGNAFAINFAELFSDSAGCLIHIDFEKDTSFIKDRFEPFSYDPDFDYLFGEANYRKRSLKRFEKKFELIYWLGEKNNDWYDIDNWSSKQIPVDSSLVHIAAFVPNMLIIDTIVKCSIMVIENDAEVTISPIGSLSVSQQLINFGQIGMQADSINRASLLQGDNMIQEGIQLYTYQSDTSIHQTFANPLQSPMRFESTQHQLATFNADDYLWEPLMFYPFVPIAEEAYQYQTNLNKLEFFGDYNSGFHMLSTPELIKPNFYPLPNPYASSINWDSVDLSGLEHKALYSFNEADSSYTNYIDGLGNASALIQPLDIFWVYTDGDEQILLDESSRLHAIDYTNDNTTKNELGIKVSGATTTDHTFVSFNSKASASFDKEYDALKFNNHAVLQIFTLGEEEHLSINQLPDTAMMDLFVKANESAAYRISIDKNLDFDFVVLEDLVWNTRTDLLKEDYTFDYSIGDGNYPFKLYFSPWALEPVEEVDIDIYYYPESLVIRSRKQVDKADITFYDLAGRAVYKFSEQNFFHIEKTISLPVGHYIVQLRSGDLVINRKVLVRR